MGVKPGRVLFELEGIAKDIAAKALALASALPNPWVRARTLAVVAATATS